MEVSDSFDFVCVPELYARPEVLFLAKTWRMPYEMNGITNGELKKLKSLGTGFEYRPYAFFGDISQDSIGIASSSNCPYHYGSAGYPLNENQDPEKWRSWAVGDEGHDVSGDALEPIRFSGRSIKKLGDVMDYWKRVNRKFGDVGGSGKYCFGLYDSDFNLIVEESLSADCILNSIVKGEPLKEGLPFKTFYIDPKKLFKYALKGDISAIGLDVTGECDKETFIQKVGTIPFCQVTRIGGYAFYIDRHGVGLDFGYKFLHEQFNEAHCNSISQLLNFLADNKSFIDNMMDKEYRDRNKPADYRGFQWKRRALFGERGDPREISRIRRSRNGTSTHSPQLYEVRLRHKFRNDGLLVSVECLDTAGFTFSRGGIFLSDIPLEKEDGQLVVAKNDYGLHTGGAFMNYVPCASSLIYTIAHQLSETERGKRKEVAKTEADKWERLIESNPIIDKGLERIG